MTNTKEVRKPDYPEDVLQVLKSIQIEVGHRVEQGEIAKSVVVPVLANLVRDPRFSAAEVISKIGVERADEEEIASIIDSIVQERRDFIKERQLGALGPLMGIAMKKLAGKAEGKEISDLLEREIKKVIAANSK
ncbi:MAG: hypothetical protein ACXACI_00235 [Candidatus Hodarchaeales archaeon]|jgi:glutamyl-tRNA(Gln) amidotransferase subunit E